jgi:hypothetical protein
VRRVRIETPITVLCVEIEVVRGVVVDAGDTLPLQAPLAEIADTGKRSVGFAVQSAIADAGAEITTPPRDDVDIVVQVRGPTRPNRTAFIAADVVTVTSGAFGLEAPMSVLVADRAGGDEPTVWKGCVMDSNGRVAEVVGLFPTRSEADVPTFGGIYW